MNRPPSRPSNPPSRCHRVLKSSSIQICTARTHWKARRKVWELSASSAWNLFTVYVRLVACLTPTPDLHFYCLFLKDIFSWYIKKRFSEVFAAFIDALRSQRVPEFRDPVPKCHHRIAHDAKPCRRPRGARHWVPTRMRFRNWKYFVMQRKNETIHRILRTLLTKSALWYGGFLYFLPSFRRCVCIFVPPLPFFWVFVHSDSGPVFMSHFLVESVSNVRDWKSRLGEWGSNIWCRIKISSFRFRVTRIGNYSVVTIFVSLASILRRFHGLSSLKNPKFYKKFWKRRSLLGAMLSDDEEKIYL